jgi:hypothetical protein
MMRNFHRGGDLIRRTTLALVAVLALNPGVAFAATGRADDAGATAAVSGALAVQSEPAGAAVYVDGRFAGSTPLQIAGVTQGDHRVRVVKEGYLENSRIVAVGTTAKSVVVKLTPYTAAGSNAAAEQVSGGGGGGGSKKWLWIGLAGGGAAAAALVLANRNSAPNAGTVSASPNGGLAASTAITFTAAGASDPDGDSLTYAWDFGDGSSATGASVSKTYQNAGTFNVTVTVSDGKKSATATGSVVIRNMTGSWSGTIGTLTFTANFTQSGTALTGTYLDRDGLGSVAGTVSAGSIVRFTVSQAGFLPFTAQGTANAAVSNVSGTIVSGFVGTPSFTMNR